MTNKNENSSIFLPLCQKCNEILYIQNNPENFSIDCICANDDNHNVNNIFYETFERFYMKEKNLTKCSKCCCILNKDIYRCNDCQFLYCNCCITKHIKSTNHEKFTIFNENKCPTHNRNYSNYCYDCNKNFCISCKKTKEHKNHSTDCYIDIIPSLSNLKILKQKFENKINIQNKLIEKIKIWKNTVINRTNELIKNLQLEISLIKNFIENFNNEIRNIAYFLNINNIIENIKDISNDDLKDFYNTNIFHKENEFMFKVLKNIGTKINNEKKTKYELKYVLSLPLKQIEKLNNDFFFYPDEKNGELLICSYLSGEKKSKKGYFQYENAHCIKFTDPIFSITHSDKNKQIYICLLNEKKVKILNYDLINPKLEIDKNEIVSNIKDYIDHFNKCISLENKYFVTVDNKNITLWKKKKKKFYLVKNVDLRSKTLDILLMDENCFISSQPGNFTLTIYNNKNLSKIKTISNIYCVNSKNCLIKAKEKYIIVNVCFGIAVISIKYKELIQYVEDINSLPQQKFFTYDGNEYIYTFEITDTLFNKKKITLMRLKFDEREIAFDKEVVAFKDVEIIKGITYMDSEIILYGDEIDVIEINY